MILKIVSGGQTGADQGALDAAIALGIPHGGWIAKGRLTENGILPAKYNLKEMPTGSNARRTEQNVLDSDGTLIISHSELTGGSALTREFAESHNRPWLHVDLNITPAFQAATIIVSWIEQGDIEILNVAGPRTSKDSRIYQLTRHIIESVCHMDITREYTPNLGKPAYTPPKTVDEAVDRLVAELPLKDKVTIANMTEDELFQLANTLGRYIQNKYELSSTNHELMNSCRSLSVLPVNNAEEASLVIIGSLYKKLFVSHKLRVIK